MRRNEWVLKEMMYNMLVWDQGLSMKDLWCCTLGWSCNTPDHCCYSNISHSELTHDGWAAANGFGLKLSG